MDIKLTPHTPGKKGFLCMPLVKNLPKIKNKSWEVTNCPICHAACYETPAMREMLENDSQLVAMCVYCAVRFGDFYE